MLYNGIIYGTSKHVWYLVGSFDFYIRPSPNCLIVLIRPTLILKIWEKVFFFPILLYKRIPILLLEIPEKRFFFFFFFFFWNFCILKREKDCVLEVCIKHVTCFKCTNMYFTSTLTYIFGGNYLGTNAYMHWVFIAICMF